MKYSADLLMSNHSPFTLMLLCLISYTINSIVLNICLSLIFCVAVIGVPTHTLYFSVLPSYFKSMVSFFVLYKSITAFCIYSYPGSIHRTDILIVLTYWFKVRGYLISLEECIEHIIGLYHIYQYVQCILFFVVRHI